MWYQSLVALDLRCLSVTATSRNSREDLELATTLLQKKKKKLLAEDMGQIYEVFAQQLSFYLLYGSAGVRVITAAGGRSYKENNRFGSSYDDKSWFGKGYIYRNYILPIFLAGLNLSTCSCWLGHGSLRSVAFVSSYWSAYGFFCLPCSILFVIAASIIGSDEYAYSVLVMDRIGEHLEESEVRKLG
ncbi:hypothetical protein Tco_0368255 [Tanacetum coccineum]